MDSYEHRVMEIVNSAHERVARLAVEAREEEEQYRESAIREIDSLEHALNPNEDTTENRHTTEEVTKKSRETELNWEDDDDLSNTTWLQRF